MHKSARVTLTILAGVSGAAHAQQAANPCGPNSFNQAACHAAVKAHGYCDGGAWVAQQYQQYPYYYDLYRTYSAAGGIVNPAPVSTCRALRHGGFGATAVAAHSHPGS
jgi:hypothetical protein